MKILSFLSGEHANILVMLCYESILYISDFEGIHPRKIVKLKRDALLCLRSACGPIYKRGDIINPNKALQYMSFRCRKDISYITYRIDQYIAEYGNAKEGEYWNRIPRKGTDLTAAELLVFLYTNYDCDIPLLPYGGIF